MIWRYPPLCKNWGERTLTEPLPLRADAKRNRDLILAAAEELFLARGAGVLLDDVAKRAGVGIGTLYRRFPTREALLAACFSERFLSLAEASRARDDALGPLGAVRAYMEELVTYSTVYRGLATSLGVVLKIGTPGCQATSEEGRRLLRRAQDTEVIRHDMSFDDLVYVAMAASLAAEQDGLQGTRIPYLIGLFLDGARVR